MNLKPALAASILFGLWASVSAQITPNSDRHLIRLKFEKGQTIAYDLTTTISIGGRKINQDQDLKIEILNLLQKDAHVKITSPDPVTSAPNSTDIVLNTRGVPTDGSSIGLGIIQLPTGAVKAGSSWQQERSLTDFMLASSLDVSSRHACRRFH
jgi:hypothetical protein